jgi:hypothetical protein
MQIRSARQRGWTSELPLCEPHKDERERKPVRVNGAEARRIQRHGQAFQELDGQERSRGLSSAMVNVTSSPACTPESEFP